MPTKAGLCDNCGARMAVAYRWQQIVVCSRCFDQLSAPTQTHSAPRRTPFLPAAATALLMMGLIVAGVAIVRHNARPSEAIAGHHTAGPSQARNVAGSADEELLPDGWDRLRVARSLPASQPATTQATATISGVVSVAPRGRSASPQPNVRVQLLRATIRRQAVQSCLAAEAATWSALAQVYEARTEDDNQLNAGDDTPRSDDSTADEEVAAGAATGLARTMGAIDAVPEEVDTAQALATLADLALFNRPYFDDAVTDALVAEARTDDQGRFTLRDVPPGDYYLHALISTGTRSSLEWCVPVHVADDAQPVRQDLGNDNVALVIGS